MKRHLAMVTGAALCVALAMGAGLVEAKEKRSKPKKEKAKPKKSRPTAIKTTGTISVALDEKGKVIKVTLAADDGTSYNVMAGGSAKKYSKLEGKTVEVSGVAVEKDGQMILRISKVKEVKEEEGEKKDEKEKKPKKGKPKAAEDQE